MLQNLMTDTLELHIYVQEIFAKKVSKTGYEMIGDVTDFGLNGSSRHVRKKDDGRTVIYEIYHAHESLPTSHSGIGFKFYHKTQNCLPYVMLNCSVAKILQGHNVFGSLDLRAGAFEMLGVLSEHYPEFVKYLDFNNIEISRFDLTLPMQTQSRLTAEKVRDYIRNVDWGRYRNLEIANKKENYNTVYFGSDKSRVGGFKLYCKGVEVEKVVNKLKIFAKKGMVADFAKLQAYTDDVLEFADKSVRLEAMIKKRMLIEHNIPTNLWQFMIYEHKNPYLYANLFTYKTCDLFTALQDMTMPYADDVKVYDMLIEKLRTTTPTGKISDTKAKNAFMFYLSIKQHGFYEIKRISNKRTFDHNIKSLVDSGFSRSYLQNLTKQDETKVLRLLNLDCQPALPSSYKEPTPTYEYYERFAPYLENALQKVA